VYICGEMFVHFHSSIHLCIIMCN